MKNKPEVKRIPCASIAHFFLLDQLLTINNFFKRKKKMKKAKMTICLMAVVFIVSANMNLCHAVEYQIIDLGVLQNGSHTYASGINESGQVVGGSEIAPGQSRAFFWDSSNGMRNLGTLGGISSTAYGINNAGQVVGYDGRMGAFIWDSSNGIRELGSGNWWAAGINESGQVVGATFLDTQAFIWQNGVRTKLGTLGGDESYGEGINNAGQVVGSAELDEYTKHAFLWKDGSMIDLGVLTGGSNSDGQNDSYAYGINNSNQVVGWSDTLQGHRHAFLWDSISGMQDLGMNGFGSEAYAINDLGWAVGKSYFPSKPYERATLWRDGEMIELDTLLPANSGWNYLGYARGINNNGWIVGMGVTDSGEERAFLFIPEPATLLLLGFGGLVLRRKRR